MHILMMYILMNYFVGMISKLEPIHTQIHDKLHKFRKEMWLESLKIRSSIFEMLKSN